MKIKFSPNAVVFKFSSEEFDLLLLNKSLSQEIDFLPNFMQIRLFVFGEDEPQVFCGQEDKKSLIDFFIPEEMVLRLSLDRGSKKGVEVFFKTGTHICLQIDTGICH